MQDIHGEPTNTTEESVKDPPPLLPPNHTMCAISWWWIDVQSVYVAAAWVGATQWWMQLVDGDQMGPDAAARAGYRLVCPYQIPGPTTLSTLHALPAVLATEATSSTDDGRRAGLLRARELLLKVLGVEGNGGKTLFPVVTQEPNE